MTAEIVVTEEGGIRIVRMNRPEKKNALTQPMYAEMTRALREAEANDTIRCVVLAGGPGAFCAGSDISDFQKRVEGGLKPVTVEFLHAGAQSETAPSGCRWPCHRHRYNHAAALRLCCCSEWRDVRDTLHQARAYSGSGFQPAWANAWPAAFST
jgi:hypothetical protein